MAPNRTLSLLSSLQADLNSTIQDGPGTFYGVSSQYSSAENMTITVSTKVCSFGKQVVEKVEVSPVPYCIGKGWESGPQGSRDKESPRAGYRTHGCMPVHGWSGEDISTMSQLATTHPCPRPLRCFGSQGMAAHPGCPPQTEYARLENGRFVYRIHRSPMCEYMINFIHKLKHLPEKYMMNSVLENFTILQVPSLLFQGAFPTRSVEPTLALTLPSLRCAAQPRGVQPWQCKYTGCA